jgi:hypothetical protein
MGGTLGLYVTLKAGFAGSFDCDSTCKTTHDEQMKFGIALYATSIGVGLALAIPGLIKLSRQSKIETEAVRRYQLSQSGHASIRPPESSRPLSAMVPGKTVGLPLLSLSF